MPFLIFCLFCFNFKSVLNKTDYNDEERIKKIMDQYKLHPIYQRIKEEFYIKYGNKDFTPMEKINMLKENLKRFFDLTNRENLPEDLKTIFRTTINGLRPDFNSLNYNDTILKSVFNLTDTESASYKQCISEASSMFSQLTGRFQIQGDC